MFLTLFCLGLGGFKLCLCAINVLREKRSRYLICSVLMMFVYFFALRFWGVCGEAGLWHVDNENLLITMMSFVNLTKYPPSLLFILLTLGICTFLLCFLKNIKT